MQGKASLTSANSGIPPSISTKGVVFMTSDDVFSPKSLKRNSSSKIAAIAERRVARGMELQQSLEEVRKLKSHLEDMEKEKSHLLNELEETKKEANDMSLKNAEALVAKKQAEDGWEMEKIRSKEIEQASIESAQKREHAWQLELDAVHRKYALDVETLSLVEEELMRVSKELVLALKERDEALKDAEVNRKRFHEIAMQLGLTEKPLGSISSNSFGILDINETNMPNTLVNSRNESANGLKVQLPKKGASTETLRHEISGVEDPEASIADLIHESGGSIHALELESRKAKHSEAKVFELLAFQTKECEQLKVSLEEAKFEISSLHESIQNLEASVSRSLKDFILHLKLDVYSIVGEQVPNLVPISSLLNVYDANANIGDSKMTLERIENKFQAFLDDVRGEVDRAKQVVERWRLEAKETQDAWKGKEAGFVEYMKISEGEMDDAKEENIFLIESLKQAEETVKLAQDENTRLRDIVRQAVNEATMARESAELARAENSELKDNLSYIGSKLQTIEEENQQLKVNEDAALEQVKVLNHLLSLSSNEQIGAMKMPNALKEDTRSNKAFHVERSREQRKLNPKHENQSIMNGSKDRFEDPNLSKISMLDVKDLPKANDFEGSYLGAKQIKKKVLLNKFGNLLRKKTSSGS